MATPNEFEVWDNRWTALQARLEALEVMCQTAKPDFPRQATVLSLVRRLKSFATGQFTFFRNGFRSNGNFEVSTEYPPQYVLKVILDQITFDLALIQRVVHQRGLPDDASTLRQADKLAWKALEPAVGADKLIKDTETTVITYFQKSDSIRIIPYAPVALIGIPFTVTSVPRDYLAIPHEVGHYVYRRGQLNGEDSLSRTLAQRVRASPPYIKNWVEEIFADVYGCLVGGPVMALDFQDLQLEESQERFIKDDKDHPVPFVRPYIYSNVLERIASFENSPNILRTHWENELEEREDPEIFISVDSTESLTRDKARTDVNTIINRVFSDLPQRQERWSGDLALEEQVDELYLRFDAAYIQSLISDPEVYVGELESESFDYAGWRNNRFFNGTDPNELPEIPAGTKEDLLEPPNGTWIQVLNAGGWTTRGPQGSN